MQCTVWLSACVLVCAFAMLWHGGLSIKRGKWASGPHLGTELAEARPRLAHVLLCLCNFVVEVGFLLSGQHPCSCLVPL